MIEYTTDTPKYDVDVVLTSNDGNAFSIIAKVDRALQRAGVSKEERQAITAQAMDGDYNHLLWFYMRIVNIELEGIGS